MSTAPVGNCRYPTMALGGMTTAHDQLAYPRGAVVERLLRHLLRGQADPRIARPGRVLRKLRLASLLQAYYRPFGVRWGCLQRLGEFIRHVGHEEELTPAKAGRIASTSDGSPLTGTAPCGNAPSPVCALGRGYRRSCQPVAPRLRT